jgi:predicted metal-dependent enzyme (double-stranded beta helix superfamily)
LDSACSLSRYNGLNSLESLTAEVKTAGCLPHNALGDNIIHSVTNPIARLTGAIHVYGGDFFGADRSEWDPETLQEGRYDVAKNMRLFEEANALYRTG